VPDARATSRLLPALPRSNEIAVRSVERTRTVSGYEDRGGIGFRAPGVSVGIGGDRY
jgi:hypothetical protein